MPDQKILIVTPSRGRPDLVQRLRCHLSVLTVDKVNTSLHVGLDDDDPAFEQYRPPYFHGPRRTLVEWTNWIAMKHVGDYQIIGSVGDDHVPMTAAWDVGLRLAFDKGAKIVYPDDHLQGERLPTACFISTHLIDALGYMMPPQFDHLYVDNVWKLWGERLGVIKYMPEIVFEHRHFTKYPGVVADASYQESNSARQYAKDLAAFEAYCAHQLDQDVARMRAVL